MRVSLIKGDRSKRKSKNKGVDFFVKYVKEDYFFFFGSRKNCSMPHLEAYSIHFLQVTPAKN